MRVSKTCFYASMAEIFHASMEKSKVYASIIFKKFMRVLEKTWFLRVWKMYWILRVSSPESCEFCKCSDSCEFQVRFLRVWGLIPASFGFCLKPASFKVPTSLVINSQFLRVLTTTQFLRVWHNNMDPASFDSHLGKVAIISLWANDTLSFIE